MNNFDELSIAAGVQVDPNTGEIIQKLETDFYTKGIIRPGSYKAPVYTQLSIDEARATTSSLSENILSAVTGGKRVQRGNNKGYDIILQNGQKMEAKVGRIGNAAVIKENQLFHFDADYWGFVFYRTFSNLPPSFFTSLQNKRSPKENLLRNIDIKSIYIFPTKVLRYYWNTAPIKKGVISTTGISHIPLALGRATELMRDENIPGVGFSRIFHFGRHSFPVKSIDLEL